MSKNTQPRMSKTAQRRAAAKSRQRNRNLMNGGIVADRIDEVLL